MPTLVYRWYEGTDTEQESSSLASCLMISIKYSVNHLHGGEWNQAGAVPSRWSLPERWAPRNMRKWWLYTGDTLFYGSQCISLDLIQVNTNVARILRKTALAHTLTCDHEDNLWANPCIDQRGDREILEQFYVKSGMHLSIPARCRAHLARHAVKCDRCSNMCSYTRLGRNSNGGEPQDLKCHSRHQSVKTYCGRLENHSHEEGEKRLGQVLSCYQNSSWSPTGSRQCTSGERRWLWMGGLCSSILYHVWSLDTKVRRHSEVKSRVWGRIQWASLTVSSILHGGERWEGASSGTDGWAWHLIIFVICFVCLLWQRQPWGRQTNPELERGRQSIGLLPWQQCFQSLVARCHCNHAALAYWRDLRGRDIEEQP